MNTAFVFIKPHANNSATQAVVQNKFQASGITIVREGEFTGEEIDKNFFIDQHYYAIASKATLLEPHQVPVPPAKFLEFFGKRWEDVIIYSLLLLLFF
jgi:hypothetical protein